MDEPLSALDKKLREQMQIEMRHLHQRLGMTTIYVTHDQREALTMSDRIAVIDEGRFHQIGSPRDIYERPASRFVAEFIGESHFCRWRSPCAAGPRATGTDRCSWRSRHAIRPASNFSSCAPRSSSSSTGGERWPQRASRGQRRRSSTRARARCSMSTLRRRRRGRDPPAARQCRAGVAGPGHACTARLAGWRHDAGARRARAMTTTSLADEDGRRDHAACKAPNAAAYRGGSGARRQCWRRSPCRASC